MQQGIESAYPLTNAGNENSEAMEALIKEDLSKIGIQVTTAFTPINKTTTSRNWDCHFWFYWQVSLTVKPVD